MGEIIVPAPLPRIDFKAVADKVRLRDLIVQEKGEPNRAGRWLCPFHDDRGNPNLGLTPDGKHFRCWSCGASGDALDWVARREGVDVIGAARLLDPTVSSKDRQEGPATASPPVRPVNPPPAAETPGFEPWQTREWQADADAIVRRAEALLWSPAGRPALNWIRIRGLADHTIRRFRLGFVADADRAGTIRATRGITIPWVAPDAWYSAHQAGDESAGDPFPRWVGVNVRRLMPDVRERWTGPNKCMALAGSRRGYAYPFDDPTPGEPVLIVEGEFDALVAFQELGHLIDIVTVGGASQAPRPEALATIQSCSAWLIATDHDQAGDESAAKWRARSPGKARRMHLPTGKDLNDFHASGGNLREWFAGELARLGL